MKNFLFIIFLSFITTTAISQEKIDRINIDSLKELLINSISDTNKVKVLQSLGNVSMVDSIENAIKYNKQALLLSVEISYKNGIAKSSFELGRIYYIQGDYLLSQKEFSRALSLFKDTKDSLRIAKTLNNLGMIAKERADYTIALDYYLKALNIAESLNDKSITTEIWNNIGLIFFWQNNYEKAEYIFKSVLR